MMRIAIFDVGHWHFPLYIPVLSDPGVTVVGICDGEGIKGPDMARQLNCPLLSRDELHAVDFDFAMIFSRHSEMAATAQKVIDKERPFLIEKPCGLNTAEVDTLRLAAKKAGVFVAVPFILRMLSKATAGGGSMINVGVHCFDLLESLTESRIVSVTAQTRTFRKDIDIDELAMFTVTMASGQIAHVHTGYLYPGTPDDQREFGFTSADGALRTTTVEYNTDHFYPFFFRDALERCRTGRPPLVGLEEAQRALSVVEAGYSSAEHGGTPVAVPQV